MNDCFFVVWEPSSGYTKYQHSNICMAEREAERLAVLNPNKSFIVLETRSRFIKDEVQRHDYCAIPF